MMTNLEQQLAAWHERHYGPAVNIPATYRKLCEEVGELGEALMKLATDGHAARAVEEEAADVAIVLTHLLRGVKGTSLVRAMTVKADMLETRRHRRKKDAEAADDLLEAGKQVLERLDYLTNLWGGEGVTRAMQDRLRKAVEARERQLSD